MNGEGSRETIKRAARALFAARGVAAVSIREILAAAGQKNGASVHYYFGSKDALVAELVADGARLIDVRRNARLDALEAGGGPHDLRSVIDVLILPSTGLAPDGGEGDYLRFISTFSLQDRAAFEAIIGDALNRGYQRCLSHIRRLSALPGDVLERRLVFLSLALRSIMTAREAALSTNAEHFFWASPTALDELARGLVSLISPE